MADNSLARRRIVRQDEDLDGASDTSVISLFDPSVDWVRVRSLNSSFNFVANAGNSNSNFYKVIDAIQRYPDVNIHYYGTPTTEGGTTGECYMLMSQSGENTGLSWRSNLQDYLQANVNAALIVSGEYVAGFVWD
jgi:hypothetical protein